MINRFTIPFLNRLFFPYHQQNKIIVFAWVNDETSKRADESSSDAYRVFMKMLESGYPPDDWDDLLKEAQGQTKRLEKLRQAPNLTG
jgi:toxin YhaV